MLPQLEPQDASPCDPTSSGSGVEREPTRPDEGAQRTVPTRQDENAQPAASAAATTAAAASVPAAHAHLFNTPPQDPAY